MNKQPIGISVPRSGQIDTAHSLFRLLLIGLLCLAAGCGSDAPATFEPFQRDIDAGLEIWRLDFDDAGTIKHYFVFENGKPVRQYMENSGEWEETTKKVEVTMDGGKEADGSIKVKYSIDTFDMQVVTDFIINGNKFTGTIVNGDEESPIAGSAERIN
ncbi:MAG: hypothetical protein HOL01_20725 [Planctomycetaceae bacterium]|jgi:hypothetical protein|nr:hypothetical protein [Planctomycetaceae bacterium]MBT6483508.1 hypothetical protein [Planctomycetaceae bacterium]MBT6496965.1 hypothetical protein [Planctomycetaceae bacterium]